MTEVAVNLRDILAKDQVHLEPHQKKIALAFAQSPDDFFSAAQYDGFGGSTANAGSYAPQSGAIFGILKNMKESFEHNLASSQKEEMEGVKSYEELKGAKETEIGAGTDQIAQKSEELAASDEKCAVDKQDLVDTPATLKADRDFLAMLK